MLRLQERCLMSCDKIKQQLWGLLDHALDPDAMAAVEAHLQICADCSRELEHLGKLGSDLDSSAPAPVPADLWSSIEQRLDAEISTPNRIAGHRPRAWKPWMLAASIAFAAGLGFLGYSMTNNRASAAAVDFSIMLDDLPVDARLAFKKFITMYGARQASPAEAKRWAPLLGFETPPQLEGGFLLQNVYVLQFGDHPGIAATYDRDGEFLATIFHKPVKIEEFGTHKDYPCVVGKHRGHKVEVGSWKLVHLTDPTTCHCVLSQLDEATELPAIMAAVAPGTADMQSHQHGE